MKRCGPVVETEVFLCGLNPNVLHVPLMRMRSIGDVSDCCAVGCERETDVAIMIDSSASIGQSKFMTLRSLAASVVNLLSVENGVVRVAVVTYAQYADVNVYLGR